MTHTASDPTLRQLVTRAMTDLELSEHHRLRLTRFAYDFVNTHLRDTAGVVKSVYVSTDTPTRIVELPPDYVQFVRMWAETSQGWRVLGWNSRLDTGKPDLAEARREIQSGRSIDGAVAKPVPINHDRLFWFNGGDIVFDPGFSPKIKLRLDYLSLCEGADDETTIAAVFQEAAIAYIRWMYVFLKPQDSRKDDFGAMYERQLTEARHRYAAIGPEIFTNFAYEFLR
jgi:hypothetical protein